MMLICHKCHKDICRFDSDYIDWKKFNREDVVCIRCWPRVEIIEDKKCECSCHRLQVAGTICIKCNCGSIEYEMGNNWLGAEEI